MVFVMMPFNLRNFLLIAQVIFVLSDHEKKSIEKVNEITSLFVHLIVLHNLIIILYKTYTQTSISNVTSKVDKKLGNK